MVWRESPPLQEPSLTRSKNVVHIVGHGVGYNRPLNVIESGAGRDSILPNDRIAHSVPGKTVVVGTLDVNERTVPRVMVREIHMRTIRSNPIPV